MRDEQKSGTRQLLTEACIVECRHHRLAGSGGGNEEVPMVPAAPGQCDLLEETFLERLWAKLDGTQRESRCSGVFGLRASEELFAVVRHEVATVPIGLEDGRDFVDDARVASARRSNVPFEATDLRRMRQVRRADVRRREARTPVEQPRLRVQTGAGHVVGDANVGTKPTKLITCPRLRRAGVRRRQDPDLTAGTAVGT